MKSCESHFGICSFFIDLPGRERFEIGREAREVVRECPEVGRDSRSQVGKETRCMRSITNHRRTLCIEPNECNPRQASCPVFYYRSFQNKIMKIGVLFYFVYNGIVKFMKQFT